MSTTVGELPPLCSAFHLTRYPSFAFVTHLNSCFYSCSNGSKVVKVPSESVPLSEWLQIWCLLVFKPLTDYNSAAFFLLQFHLNKEGNLKPWFPWRHNSIYSVFAYCNYLAVNVCTKSQRAYDCPVLPGTWCQMNYRSHNLVFSGI